MRWLFDQIILRWLYSLGKELHVEAEWCRDHGHADAGIALACMAAAFTRANGKLE